MHKRLVTAAISVAILVVLSTILVGGSQHLRNYLPFVANSGIVDAQDRPTSDMEQRLEQVIEALRATRACGTAAAAVDDGMEILYGGLRPLPSKGLPEQTENADQVIAENEMRFAEALGRFAQQGEGCDEERRRALDLKLFIEEMNEVARAVGEITRQCGNGDSLERQPCSELRPLLDEHTGEVPRADQSAQPGAAGQPGATIRPSFSVKLRSPFVPPWWLGGWEEETLVTEPLSPGQCAVVFKETKGLMLRLHFEGVTIVRDPWVSTFGVPRGTRIPIWALEWVPAEYAKEWNICHIQGGQIRKTVTQRVKQDIPLNFFWRFYPKDP